MCRAASLSDVVVRDGTYLPCSGTGRRQFQLVPDSECSGSVELVHNGSLVLSIACESLQRGKRWSMTKTGGKCNNVVCSSIGGCMDGMVMVVGAHLYSQSAVGEIKFNVHLTRLVRSMRSRIVRKWLWRADGVRIHVINLLHAPNVMLL